MAESDDSWLSPQRAFDLSEGWRDQQDSSDYAAVNTQETDYHLSRETDPTVQQNNLEDIEQVPTPNKGKTTAVIKTIKKDGAPRIDLGTKRYLHKHIQACKVLSALAAALGGCALPFSDLGRYRIEMEKMLTKVCQAKTEYYAKKKTERAQGNWKTKDQILVDLGWRPEIAETAFGKRQWATMEATTAYCEKLKVHPQHGILLYKELDFTEITDLVHNQQRESNVTGTEAKSFLEAVKPVMDTLEAARQALGIRYLICVIRKSDLCRCGCRGFCTLGTILRVIAWAFNVLAVGLYLLLDHEGKPFEDLVRANKHRFTIAEGWVGALTELRADLLEIFERIGVTRFSNVLNPCFQCSVHKSKLFDFPVSMEACQWVPRDETVYNLMMHRALVKRTVVNRAQLRRLMTCMHLDEELGGLGLHTPFPELGLEKGYRLIEDGDLHDIHALRDAEVPIELTFFNALLNLGLNMICPLFRIHGFTYSMIHLDSMHVLDLGVTQFVVGAIFLLMLKRNFAKSRHFKADGRRAANIDHLRRRLKVHYRPLVDDDWVTSSEDSVAETIESSSDAPVEIIVFGTADPPRPRGGLFAISRGQLAFILGAFTRRGKPLADIVPLVACRDGGRDLLKASCSHATTCPASHLVDVGLHCAVATGVADRRGASILFEDVRESRCALPEPKADDLRQTRQAAQAWAGGGMELPRDGSCHVDHSVGRGQIGAGGRGGAAASRSPRAGLQKHLAEQEALGVPHHAAISSEDHKCFWVLALPLPRQFDARRRRCRTCAAAGLPNRYFATDVSDVVAAVPGVLHLRLEKQGSVFMTKQFLLHLVQLFHDRLCLRQTRRALVEQCCAGAAGLRAAGRVLSYLRAIPTAPGLKQISLTALEGYLAEATRHMLKRINVYSGAVIRGDGNYEQARKVAVEGDSGRDRPCTVLLAWVTVGGALYQPPTLSRSEDVKDALQDLGPLVGSFKQDRLEAGLSLVDSAPAVHATDVYGRQRLQLNAFYRRMYPELDADAAAGAPTPRGDATGARTRFAGSPTTVTGDPLHDTLAVMRLISAASPDARNMCYDHKRREDMLNRLSLPPRRPAAAAPVPAEQLPSAPVAGPPDVGAGEPAAQPLAVEHHEMLRKAVENTKEQTAAAIRENPASADAVAAYLKQPRVDQEPTWRTIFGASPTRGAVLRLCAAFGVHAHDTLGYHGFETLACFKNAIRTHLKWYAPGRKTCRARRGICRRLQAASRLHGKRSALTMSVQAHYDRLLKPLRLEGLWKWRDAALAIADAGVPLQTGTVAVERWWASLKHMMPAKAACISERWFRVLIGLAYLRHNHRHFASGSLPSWCRGDPLLQQRLAYFADCARLVQSEGDGHLSAIFDPFR
ncbi:unnamed protein product [Prorocentrum cordatum]|uniref:Uncharacterized protein n=1 Tax=Prorocentrum cordatum TaxID=2364126 RepID=A0ABN9SI94_9DINO|nr:unnamed protein product [Polarella glacialis]